MFEPLDQLVNSPWALAHGEFTQGTLAAQGEVAMPAVKKASRAPMRKVTNSSFCMQLGWPGLFLCRKDRVRIKKKISKSLLRAAMIVPLSSLS